MILTEYISLLRSNSLMAAGCIVLAEAVLIGVWGFPDFDEGYTRITVSYTVVFYFSLPFFDSILTSWVTHIWSASKVAYGRVWSAGNKAWVYVLGIGRKV